MATTLWNRWTEERQARKSHDCTFCRAEICPSEFFAREAVPPWINGQGYWMIFNYCHKCRRG